MSNETAARVVSDFLEERTATASAEANVQAVVRLAYKVTYDEANGLETADRGIAFRVAAQVATGGRLSTQDLVDAVKFNMGL